MSTTTKTSIASRAAKLADRSMKTEYKAVDSPVNSVDFVQSFKSATSATIKTANVFTVDVFPNMIPILMYIHFHCNQTISRLDDRSHAKVTLPTYVMYCLSIVYGHILTNDMYVRPSPSNFAEDYLAIPEKKRLLDLILNLPVPTFLEPLLAHLTAATPPHSNNIVFCPSAAGVTIHTHFGRMFPINIYSLIHDFTAELNSRMTPATVNACLHSRTVFTITATPGQPAFAATIANHIGSIQSATADITHAVPANRNYTSYQSVLRQSFDSTFNPVLSRDYTRRQALAPLNITSPVFNHPFPNPYDILFAYSPSNFNELRIVFTSIAHALDGAVPIKSDLAQIISANSGMDIFTHGYSSMALPTWHAIHLAENTRNADIHTINQAPTETRLPPDETAAVLHFLETPEFDAAAVNVVIARPTAACDTNAAHAVTITPGTAGLDLVEREPFDDDTGPYPNVPRQNEFIQFSEQRDTAPLLTILEPIESNTETAWKASAFGMIIESFEIDGTAIPIPNAEAPLALENARFAESAIPYLYAISALDFDGQQRHYVLRRTTERRNAFRFMTHLVDYARVALCRLARRVIPPLLNNMLPGFTYVNNVTWPNAMLQFICARTESPAHQGQPDAQPPNTAPRRIYAWSPYTYVPVPGDFNNPLSRLGHQTVPTTGYFLTNLRTIFGTDPQLIEAQHYFNSMPIS
jgi:hypothetical protein